MKMKLHKCEHHVAAQTKHPNSLYGSRQMPCKYEGKRWQATCINRFPHHIAVVALDKVGGIEFTKQRQENVRKRMGCFRA